MPRKQRKKKSKEKNTKFRKLRRAIFWFLFITVGVISFCLFTPFFNVNSIVINGNEQVPADQIEQTSGILYQTNIFKMSRKKVAENLSSIAYIKDVKVQRKLPAKVVITVAETHPALCFSFMSGYVVTDTSGKVLEQETQPRENLPIVLGVDIKNAEISQKIAVQDSIKFDIIITSIGDLEKRDLMAEIAQLDFTDISRFTVYLKSGLKIIFGKISDMDYKISMLTNVLPQIDQSQGAYVDLTTPSNVFYGRAESTQAPAQSPAANNGG